MRDRDALLELLGRAMEQLSDHALVPGEGMDGTYAPGKWTARQIYFHTVDAGTMMWWRFCKATAEPGSRVELMDQDAWTARLIDPERPQAAGSSMLSGALEFVRHAVATMPDGQLDGTVIHPERGAISAWQIAEGLARHTLHHLEQIACIRAGRPWPPKP
jgi:hypothetical protein